MRHILNRTLLTTLLALLLGLFAAPGAQGGATYIVNLPLIATQARVTSSSELQQALDAAQPGETIELAAAAYSGDLKLKRSGMAGAPITLRGAGRGLTTIDGAVQIQGAAHIVIQDLDIDPSDGDDGLRIEAPAHDVVLQRAHVHDGNSYGVRIDSDVHDVLIEDCEIDHFDAGSSDAHGVGIQTASNITVRRCNIHHNSGDAIQSNTPDYPGYNRFASEILIEKNDLHDNRENAVDIKSTHGIVVRNNRMWGVRVVDSSDGMAVEVQYDAQDVTIIGNQIWDAVQGIEVTRGSKNGQLYPRAPARVLVAGNLIRDCIAQGNDSGSGSALIVRSSGEVKMYNNTTHHIAGAGLYVSYSSGADLPSNLDVRNNILDGATNDLYFARDPGNFTGLVVDHNHYVNGTIRGAVLADWLALGYERHASSGDAALDTAFLPPPASPLVDSGTDVGLAHIGSAPDRGWSEFAPAP